MTCVFFCCYSRSNWKSILMFFPRRSHANKSSSCLLLNYSQRIRSVWFILTWSFFFLFHARNHSTLLFPRTDRREKDRKMNIQISPFPIIAMCIHINILSLTCSICIEASRMKHAGIQFQTDNGKNDNSKKNEKCDLKQWSHGFQNRFQHHLKTFFFWLEEKATIQSRISCLREHSILTRNAWDKF